MVEKKCQSNAKTSLYLPQRPLAHLRFLQNRDAPVKMSQNKLSEKFEEHEVQALLELKNFIASNPDSRELKRALAVRMLSEAICRETIQKLLGVSSSFISKWKINYALHGIEGLLLNRQGSQGQLKPEEQSEIIQ